MWSGHLIMSPSPSAIAAAHGSHCRRVPVGVEGGFEDTHRQRFLKSGFARRRIEVGPGRMLECSPVGRARSPGRAPLPRSASPVARVHRKVLHDVDTERAKTLNKRLAPACQVLTKGIEAHANRCGKVAIRPSRRHRGGAPGKRAADGLQALETLPDPGSSRYGSPAMLTVAPAAFVDASQVALGARCV